MYIVLSVSLRSNFNNRRHTSFAAVSVTPEIDDSVDVEINVEDIRIDTYRSSGAGGQHVNVTDSAVRIIHKPTGIMVQCQNERSQHKNREIAMKVLRSRLYNHLRAQRDEELAKLKPEIRNIDFRKSNPILCTTSISTSQGYENKRRDK